MEYLMINQISIRENYQNLILKVGIPISLEEDSR